MMKLLFLVFFFLLSSIGYSFNLRVGIEASSQVKREKGTPSEITSDIAHFLGEYVGRKVSIEKVSFSGLFPYLKIKHVDLTISPIPQNKEKSRSIEFSDPCLKIGQCLLVHKNSDIRSLEDANQFKKIIAVRRDSFGHNYAKQNLKRAKILVFDSEEMCFQAVVQKKADAFIYDQLSIYAFWKKNKETTKGLFKPFATEIWAIGVIKGNELIKNKINLFLKEFRQKNGFEDLIKDHFNDEKEEMKKLGIFLNF